MDDDKVLNMETQFRIKALMDELERVQNENTRLTILLKEAGVEEDGLKQITDEEIICVQQIARLKETSDERALDKDEVKNLDILHKNLKIARGEDTRVGRKSKTDEITDKDLEKLVKGK